MRSYAKKQDSNFDIRPLISDVILGDVTKQFWVATKEADIMNEAHISNVMAGVNTWAIKNNPDLSGVERAILAHMNTHYNIINAANVLQGDPGIFLNNPEAYGKFYEANLIGEINS